MKKYYSSERLKEITYTNEIQQDLCIYDRKNQVKLMTLIHDMDLEINNLQEENKRLKKNQRYCKKGVFSLEYDKETLTDMVDDLQQRIDKAIKYCEDSSKTIKSEYFSDVIKILKGDE